jgi:hypothetical protein
VARSPELVFGYLFLQLVDELASVSDSSVASYENEVWLPYGNDVWLRMVIT